MGMVFGFKLHALTSLDGLFERWAFAAANHPDVRLARELTAGLEGQPVLGDKAYIGIGVLTPKRSNMTRRVGTPKGGPQPWGSNGVWSESLDRARKRVESSFSTLVRSLTLHAAQVKTFLSLHPYPESPSLGPTLNASEPQDRSLQPAPLGGAIQVANDVIGNSGSCRSTTLRRCSCDWTKTYLRPGTPCPDSSPFACLIVKLSTGTIREESEASDQCDPVMSPESLKSPAGAAKARKRNSSRSWSLSASAQAGPESHHFLL